MRFFDRIRFIFGSFVSNLIWQPTASRQLTLPDMDGQLVGQVLEASQPLAAGTTITVTPNAPRSIIPITSAGVLTVTASPVIQTAGVVNGQQVLIYNAGSFPVTLTAGGTLIAPSNITISPGQFVEFIFSSNLGSWLSPTGLIKDNGVALLAKNNTEVTHTGTTAETIIYSYTVPANTLSAGDMLINEIWTGFNSSAGQKTIRVRAGGIGGTIIYQQVFSTNTAFARLNHALRFINSSSQRGMPLALNGFGVLNAAPPTYTINFTNSVTIVVTAQLQTAADQARFYGHTAYCS